MFRIRFASKKDHKSIFDFQKRMALETEDLILDSEILLQGVLSVFKDQYKGTYLVAEDKGDIISSLLITKEWSDWRNKYIYWLQSVYVIPEYRGKKVFSAMYRFVKDLAKKDDMVAGIRLYVDNTNEKALKVYEKIGMDGNHYRTFEWMKQNNQTE